MASQCARVFLRQGREFGVLALGHPHIFRNALDAKSLELIESSLPAGTIADLCTSSGKVIARGSVSGGKQTAGHSIVFTSWMDKESEIGDMKLCVRSRLKDAVKLRKNWLMNEDAVRLVWGESDRMPGIVIDKYSSKFVVQIRNGCAEIKGVRDLIVEELNLEFGNSVNIYERSDVRSRVQDGLSVKIEQLQGNDDDWGVWFSENGCSIFADLKQGHKTGFYLDQKENRKILSTLVKGSRVLDCFSYTGGFTLNALKGNADSVTSIDMSGSALELLKENVKRNNFPNSKNHAVLNGNCFDLLRELKDRQETYDCIVLDPPKMISSPQTFSSGKKGYVEINSSAMRLIRPGGLLFTFTCSGGASLPDFMKFVSLAASKAGRSVQVVKYLHQSADHPVALKFMGSDYLKGLLCIVN